LNSSSPVELIDTSEESSKRESSNRSSTDVSKESNSLAAIFNDLSIINLSPSKKSTSISVSFISSLIRESLSKKSVLLKAGPVITGSEKSSATEDFSLIKSVTVGVTKEVNNLKTKKEKAQPTKIKTGGSTFKNPIKQTNKKVWEIIKESVPNDIQFGDAIISGKHANFFINKNNASYKDMKKLIDFVKEKVNDKTGVKLDLEIILVE